MPTLETHPSFSCVKMLYLGDSGSGKTGSLASLAQKYRLFIQDFDNGLDILTDPKILPPEFRKNVHYVTLTDKLEDGGNGLVICKNPIAASKSAALMNKWEDQGSIYTWGPDTVFIIDSITLQGKAIMRLVQHLNGKTGLRPSQPIWGDAIDRQEGILQALYSDAVKCHVICIAHVREIDLQVLDENDPGYTPDVHQFPSFLGRQLPKYAARYFNTVCLAKTLGTGPNPKRIIRTRSLGNMELKVSAPSKVETELPLETGLLTLFQRLTAK